MDVDGWFSYITLIYVGLLQKSKHAYEMGDWLPEVTGVSE